MFLQLQAEPVLFSLLSWSWRPWLLPTTNLAHGHRQQHILPTWPCAVSTPYVLEKIRSLPKPASPKHFQADHCLSVAVFISWHHHARKGSVNIGGAEDCDLASLKDLEIYLVIPVDEVQRTVCGTIMQLFERHFWKHPKFMGKHEDLPSKQWQRASWAAHRDCNAGIVGGQSEVQRWKPWKRRGQGKHKARAMDGERQQPGAAMHEQHEAAAFRDHEGDCRVTEIQRNQVSGVWIDRKGWILKLSASAKKLVRICNHRRRSYPALRLRDGQGDVVVHID